MSTVMSMYVYKVGGSPLTPYRAQVKGYVLCRDGWPMKFSTPAAAYGALIVELRTMIDEQDRMADETLEEQW